MTTAYISLGSNLGEKLCTLQEAARVLGCLHGLQITASSGIYLTEPQDFHAQDWFANQVMKLEAGGFWHPRKLLGALLGIEALFGRSRMRRFGPRTLDIDLLLYGEITMNTPECVLPHPRMTRRAFVLYPLLELEPDLTIDRKPVKNILGSLDWRLEGDRIYQPSII